MMSHGYEGSPVLRQFEAAMARRGLVPPKQIIADGKIHRCKTQAKNGRGDGAYLLHLDGVIPAGGFENWQDGQGWDNWKFNPGRELTRKEQDEVRRKSEAAAKARREAKERSRKDIKEGGAALGECAAVPGRLSVFREKRHQNAWRAHALLWGAHRHPGSRYRRPDFLAAIHLSRRHEALSQRWACRRLHVPHRRRPRPNHHRRRLRHPGVDP
jgi:hypothetical protein